MAENKYLEKAAGILNQSRIYGKAALQVAKANPLVAAGATVGGLDGALKTTRKKDESAIKAGLRGVRNVAVGAAGGAVVGGVLQHVGKSIAQKAG